MQLALLWQFHYCVEILELFRMSEKVLELRMAYHTVR